MLSGVFRDGLDLADPAVHCEMLDSERGRMVVPAQYVHLVAVPSPRELCGDWLAGAAFLRAACVAGVAGVAAFAFGAVRIHILAPLSCTLAHRNKLLVAPGRNRVGRSRCCVENLTDGGEQGKGQNAEKKQNKIINLGYNNE